MAKTRRRIVSLVLVAGAAAAVALVRQRRLDAARQEFERRFGAG
jgi:hypothetical protein